MNSIAATFILFVLCISATAQYDKALADSLGADDHGMKAYVLAILKTGSNTTASKAELDAIFQGHMANISKLVNDGKLVVAGPLQKNDRNYRGIFILDAKTIDEARAFVDTDPVIKSKVMDVELFQWYGSAALPVYLNAHKRIDKTKR